MDCGTKMSRQKSESEAGDELKCSWINWSRSNRKILGRFYWLVGFVGFVGWFVGWLVGWLVLFFLEHSLRFDPPVWLVTVPRSFRVQWAKMDKMVSKVSNMFYVHPENLRKWSNLTSIFFRWVGSTTNYNTLAVEGLHPRRLTAGTWEYIPGQGLSSSKPSFSGSILNLPGFIGDEIPPSYVGIIS